jgi:bifunctional non-homologous end joining protein LigD
VRLCAFDLLELDGEDFRDKPLQERKRRLARLLRKDRDGLEYVPHSQGDGELIFEQVCKLGFEGIVSKRTDVPYRAGRYKHWLKLKNRAHPAIMRVKEAFELERERSRRHNRDPNSAGSDGFLPRLCR